MLGCASVLLHYGMVNWISQQLAAPGRAAHASNIAPLPTTVPASAPMIAQLRLSDALPVTAPPQAYVQPRLKSAARTIATAVPVQTPAQEQVQAPPPPQPPQPQTQGYQVMLPPSAELTFDVTRMVANDGVEGAVLTGRGGISWQHGNGKYRMHAMASVMKDAVLDLFQLSSDGEIGETGIIPRTMAEKRGGRAPIATHFNGEQQHITFSASSERVALQPGAQDSVTFVMQLAAIARANSAQLAHGVEIQVAGGREAQNHRFILAGQEQLQTAMGSIATWRVQRPAPPGSYNAQWEIWLAPDYHWYPVQLRSTEANGTVTLQTIRQIEIKEN